MEAGKNVKEKGLDNNLLELIAADPAFNLSLDELKKKDHGGSWKRVIPLRRMRVNVGLMSFSLHMMY